MEMMCAFLSMPTAGTNRSVGVLTERWVFCQRSIESEESCFILIRWVLIRRQVAASSKTHTQP